MEADGLHATSERSAPVPALEDALDQVDAGELRVRSVADLHMCSPWWMFSMLTRMKSGWDSWVESELGEATDGCGRIEVVDVDVLLGTADGAVGAFEDGDEEPLLALEDTGDDTVLRAVADPGQAGRMLGAAR